MAATKLTIIILINNNKNNNNKYHLQMKLTDEIRNQFKIFQKLIYQIYCLFDGRDLSQIRI